MTYTPTEETIVAIKTLVKPFVGALIALIKSIQDKDLGKKKRKKAEAGLEQAIEALFNLCPDIQQVEAAIAKTGTAGLAKDVIPAKQNLSKARPAKKPAVKKPVAKKPATKKPVVKKRGAGKPA